MLDVMPISQEQIFSELKAQLSAETVFRQKEPLAKRTTLRVGGPADFYVEPVSENELSKILNFCSAREIPVMVLGRGSNLLIRDGGIRGVVICLSHPNFSKIQIQENRLKCGAGAKLKEISVQSRRNGVSGLEFLEGIPGSLGGALRMNAGAMGSQTFDAVESVRFVDRSGEFHQLTAAEMHAKYRSCALLKENIAVSAVLKGNLASSEVIAQKMSGFSNKRWDTQPAKPSAGCTFKNPATIPAGKLIDELGLKGTRVGSAAVSDIHGNFIVNEGNATAKDVLKLIEIVRQRARETRAIELETEVEIVGEDLPES